MNYIRTHIGVRIALIIAVFVFLIYAIGVRGGVGTTFATNTGTGQPPLQLKIDSETYYNGVLQPTLSWELKNLVPGQDRFFNFTDVKPGDTGTTTISLHLQPSSAWMCLDFLNLKDKENDRNEPERHVDADNEGELSEELEFFAWRDDGDNRFEIGEIPLFGTSSQAAAVVLKGTSYALADSTTGAPYAPNVTKYIGITWCAGNLSVNVATAKITCDPTAMGNEAQTDSMTLDVSLRAVAATQQPNFVCKLPHIPTPPGGTCEIEGHKYDQDGKPLANWDVGLSKAITHNRGVDIYDLATDITDVNGYFCLDWNGESRTPRGPITYKSGSYSFTYYVYEKQQAGWTIDAVEKGPNYFSLVPVPPNQILADGIYRSVQIGATNGYILKNAAYHVDFYNRKNTQISNRQVWQKSNTVSSWLGARSENKTNIKESKKSKAL